MIRLLFIVGFLNSIYSEAQPTGNGFLTGKTTEFCYRLAITSWVYRYSYQYVTINSTGTCKDNYLKNLRSGASPQATVKTA
jgi:hypothetical protein